MLARQEWAIAGTAHRGLARAGFGTRRKRWRDLDLTVDLADDIFSRRWWRGLATLLLLVASAALTAPGFGPLPGGAPAQVSEPEQEQLSAAGVGSLAEGSDSGLAMAATAAVEPLATAPERPNLDLFATVAAGDTLSRLLVRMGASYGDAGQAEALVGRIAPGTPVAITLGRKNGPARPVERIALRGGFDALLTVIATPAGLQLQRQAIAVDSTPLRIRGRVGDGLYWSLRAAGVTPQTAEDYLKALAGQIDVGTMDPNDRFDLVVANRRASTGESQAGTLLYAGLERTGARPLQLVKWTAGGTTQWFEASGVGKQTSGMSWPVNAPITSSFGLRVHPILRFARMHKGIDFGARWGTPIVAAADGQVERASWSAGYGQQVRLAHGNGLETSYSHMSRMTVAPGMAVRQGQLIGYVGATGLATGPHLHYEVLRGGTQVNPLSVRFTSRSVLDGPALGAFQSRLKALLSVGVRS